MLYFLFEIFFSGYDLVEWLMDRLDIEDGTEALHLATLLCCYGYFFPVTDTKTLSVKDDGTLYRFQVRRTFSYWHLMSSTVEFLRLSTIPFS